MEDHEGLHPSKRRKVELEEDMTTGNHGSNKGRDRSGSLGERRGKSDLAKIVLPAHHAFGVHGAPRQKIQHFHDSPDASETENTKIQPRSPPESASTVLAIAIDNGQGKVSELDVPMASKSVYIQGYGELTMGNDGTKPTITATPDNNSNNQRSNPGAVTPPPAIAASQARNQALQTQEAIAHQLDVAPQAPSSVPPSSVPAPATAAMQSPMVANTPGSRSQQVLSTPPTPVPTTPKSSAASSASYFSSAPASITQSSPSVSNIPPTSQATAANISPPPASNNSSSIASTFLSQTSSASTNPISVTSQASITSSELAQSTASQASLSNVESLAALASASSSLSGFSTSTISSQTVSSGSSSSVPTTLISSTSQSSSSPISSSASATSPLASQSASGSSSSATAGVGAGGVGGTSTSGSPTASPPSTGGSSSSSNSPSASQLAGGIVGGVAGLTILILIAIFLLRWRKAKSKEQRTISPPMPQAIGPGGVPQPMTQRSSTAPIAAAGLLGRLRPASAQTANTADTGPSERGFQKISGRKLPSVLTAGGDGYGDSAAGPSTAATAGAMAGGAAGASRDTSRGLGGPQAKGVVPGQPFAGLAAGLRPPSPQRSLSGSSFYRDSHGFYGGVVPESTTQAETDTSSSPSTSPSYPAPVNFAGRGPHGPSSRQPEVAITRPGPARTPVINQPGVVPVRTPSRANQPPQRPAHSPFRDGLGRSHPSQDGSRGSRFREDTTPP